jgi:hypothetical protein
VKATTLGVKFEPSAFGMTFTLPSASITAMTELVVPKSMPTARAIGDTSLRELGAWVRAFLPSPQLPVDSIALNPFASTQKF